MKKNIIIVIMIILVIPLIYGFTPYDNILQHENNKTNQIKQFESYLDNKDYNGIVKLLENKIFFDNNYFVSKYNHFETLLNIYKSQVIANTNKYINNSDYVSANNLLVTAYKYFKDDNTINHLISLNNKLLSQHNTTTYTGPIEHLNFQTLIAFPEKTFNQSNINPTIEEEKLTTSEFSAILEELYRNNYILVDIFDIINTDNLSQKKLTLPKNKKPIIFSFDNVTYRSNYQNLGAIDKIILDRNNNLATYTTKKSIQDRIQYDNEFIVILEKFINAHPDFSHNNARGIIFLTGENGILGYNTCHKNASYKYEAKRASEVIKKLKNNGWRFGCNSYTYSADNTKTELDFAKEISLWNKELKSIIGETTLYSHPYGIQDTSEKKLEILLSNNFSIHFQNSYSNDITFYESHCILNRKAVNGKSLRSKTNEFKHLFNCEKVYDHNNRQISYIYDSL